MGGVAVYQLIPEPNPFRIDFMEMQKKQIQEKGIIARIKNVALPAFLDYFKVFVTSATQSFKLNVRVMPYTLRSVLQRAPGSPEELVARIGIWLILHVIGFVVVTCTNLIQNVYSMPRQLPYYADPLINTKHMKIKDEEIDVRHIPDTVSVTNLISMFDEINFTNPENPGYMGPSSRKEGPTTFSVNELRSSLTNKFVANILGRVAFIGTPPSWNIAQLHLFYKQIDDVVRFSIDKVNTQLDEFKAKHQNWSILSDSEKEYQTLKLNYGNEPIPDSNPDSVRFNQLQEDHKNYLIYNDLLQSRARLVIDFAIAGNYCGARYMGDAMEAYLFHKGETTGETLADEIEKILGKKRETIAREHIGKYMTTDVHNFAAYMANLGGLLGIPGTKNVIEHLGGLYNRRGLITHFFEDYNPKTIRESVQERFKNSQSFREKIYEWLKDNGGDWMKDVYEEKEKAILETVSNGKIEEDTTKEQKEVDLLLKLVPKLLDQKIIYKTSGGLKVSHDNSSIANIDNWSDFLNDLLAIPEAKEIIDQELGKNESDSKAEIMIRRNNWKTAMKHPLFVPNLKLIMYANILDGGQAELDVTNLVRTQKWMRLVNQELSERDIPSISTEILMRCHSKEADFEKVLKSHLEQMRHNEFVDALKHINEEEKLRPEILEWVLVAHGVLNPPTKASQRVVE